MQEGYWWTWSVDGNETVGLEKLNEYQEFVNNILTFDDDYDRSTMTFNGAIPKPFKCPEGADACPARDGISSSCGDGYEGWLCSKCRKKYYPWFEKCLKCPPWWHLVIELFIVVLVVIGLVVFTIRNYNQQERSPLDTLVGRFKIVLGYYQIAGAIFTSIHDIKWPVSVSKAADILKYLELNILKLLAKPRCYIDILQLNIYVQLQVAIIFFASVILFPCMIYACLKLYNRCRFRHDTIPNRIHDWMKGIRAKCYFVVVILLFITFPSICEVITGLMPPACDIFCLNDNCTQSVTKLRTDYAIDCKSPTHMHFQYAAYTCLIYVIGFPVCTLLLIKKHLPKTGLSDLQNNQNTQNTCQCHEPENERNEAAPSQVQEERSTELAEGGTLQEELLSINSLTSNGADDEETANAGSDEDTVSDSNESDVALVHRTSAPSPNNEPLFIRFLCENYKPEYWFWEIVELSRKLLQTSLVVLWGSTDPLTLGLSISVSMVYTVIHAYVKPMKDTFEHWLQMLSLMAIFFNLLTAIYFKVPYDSHRETLMTVFIFMINISVVLLAIGK